MEYRNTTIRVLPAPQPQTQTHTNLPCIPEHQPLPFPLLSALPLKGHWLTGGGMVISELCMVLTGQKGGDRKREVQAGKGGPKKHRGKRGKDRDRAEERDRHNQRTVNARNTRVRD